MGYNLQMYQVFPWHSYSHDLVCTTKDALVQSLELYVFSILCL